MMSRHIASPSPVPPLPLASGPALVREERIEDLAQRLGRNAAARVADHQVDHVGLRVVASFTMIKPPLGMACRALISRLMSTC